MPKVELLRRYPRFIEQILLPYLRNQGRSSFDQNDLLQTGANVNDRASSQSPAILIVESDQATRDLYERELGRRYRVRVCGDEQAARKMVEMCVPDAIVVEPNALEDDQWTFLHAFHAAPATRHIPIVICTSLDERRRGLEMGVAAYLVKPVLPMTLAQRLAHILHHSPDEEVNRAHLK